MSSTWTFSHLAARRREVRPRHVVARLRPGLQTRHARVHAGLARGPGQRGRRRDPSAGREAVPAIPGGSMKSKVTGALLAAGIALASLATTALPAAASTSGSESVKGIIVASGVSGTRTPIFSVAVATGVFRTVSPEGLL